MHDEFNSKLDDNYDLIASNDVCGYKYFYELDFSGFDSS